MIKPPSNPFYYLDNFHTVLTWIGQRYGDLLTNEELDFMRRFMALPEKSRALLVRMVMRKGELFRSDKLQYEEIGCPQQAASLLLSNGWICDRSELTLEQLFGLLKKSEIAGLFRDRLPDLNARKAEQLETLLAQSTSSAARTFGAWWPGSGICVYQLRIADLCDRFRLMFFGNAYQDWTEFVLADLGIYLYEKVELSAASRAFRNRGDIDDSLLLHRCRQLLDQGELPELVAEHLPARFDNGWLEARRAKLLFLLAQRYEREGQLQQALDIYLECTFPGARLRAIRVMERCEQCDAAFALACEAERSPESEAEKQQLSRVLPRLRRKLGHPKITVAAALPASEMLLSLHLPEEPLCVEDAVRQHLQSADAQASVHYVENTLINSLFGLLCWNAVFAPVPGAFFHPFHRGPADLHDADFRLRRQQEFADCLSQLDSQQYAQTIVRNFREKAGIQSPFVFWEILSEELLALALACIPAAHLKKWFERILQDIRANRSGLPDLIRFWPQEMRYQMVEVKGPGDRLQDNQLRWLDFCAAHDMPVAVCYVQWEDA